MAYTIVKSDGTILTTIADGTINTTSTSLGLPGRNYAGYGQALDTNFVHQIENFAASSPPANPLRGQLWYNINNSTLYVCPTDGETDPANWTALSSTTSGGTTTFGAVTVTGNLTANNITSIYDVSANSLTVSYATVSANANIADANITTANIGTITTANITTGSLTNTGNIIGVWTVSGSAGGNGATAFTFAQGGIEIQKVGPGVGYYGIKCDNYMYANGDPISFAGTYSNSNVQSYLPTYAGNFGAAGSTSIFNGNTITTGSASNAGTITGNWTLTAGSRWNATYADLAERFAADDAYDAGTVVELGGEKEITAVRYELSEDVFGVISNSAGYIMNAGAGNDSTHPAVAVSGRVRVKVTGKVKKGQRLVSAGKGVARAAEQGEATAFNTIGRSLENKISAGVGTVEAIVIIR
jgi:hypothetical protein